MRNILTLAICAILVLSVFPSTGSPSDAWTGSGAESAAVPIINVTPQEIDFGSVLVGATSEQVLTLRNDGNTPLTV